MSVHVQHDPLGVQDMLSSEERRARLRALEAEGVDLRLLAEQLRLSPTAHIESMLRLNSLCVALMEAEERDERSPSARLRT